ncbi:hypothetical protein [Algibacter sp. 2305UL17-15]|uniref:hypothetical protein n=1 Tax=Algibacter sp. 2305UL17-15 TaxID=3231268 RepID=UPI003458EF84
MKQLFFLLFFSLIFVSCSSSEDNNDDMDNMLQGHYSLRINGDGFNDELFIFDRDTIEFGNLGIKHICSDNSSNSLFFAIPSADKDSQYTIVPFASNTTSTSSVILSGNGVYLSEDGNIFIDEIITDGNCFTYKGSLNINYRRQDNKPGTINIQGSFEVPVASICD